MHNIFEKKNNGLITLILGIEAKKKTSQELEQKIAKLMMAVSISL